MQDHPSSPGLEHLSLDLYNLLFSYSVLCVVIDLPMCMTKNSRAATGSDTGVITEDGQGGRHSFFFFLEYMELKAGAAAAADASQDLHSAVCT